MKELPDNKTLNILWTVATSSSIESGTRPHILFARLLYTELSDEEFPFKLPDPK
jgi:hypothetical protein